MQFVFKVRVWDFFPYQHSYIAISLTRTLRPGCHSRNLEVSHNVNREGVLQQHPRIQAVKGHIDVFSDHVLDWI